MSVRTCSVIIGVVTPGECHFLPSVIREIRRQSHPSVSVEVIVIDQSGTDILTHLGGIIRIVAPKIDAGTAIDIGLEHAGGEYVCTLDADAFPIHPGWLHVPITLIERHGYSFVGNSTGMHEAYPGLGPFFHLNNYYRVSRTDLTLSVSRAIGFRRSVGDNGVAAMQFADIHRLGPKLSFAITSALGHTPEMGLYGMVIEDLVFHLVFGFAEDWIKTMEKTLGPTYLALRDKLFSEGITPENRIHIFTHLEPVVAFGRREFRDSSLRVLDPSEPLSQEIDTLKTASTCIPVVDSGHERNDTP